jgi:UPF0755 protein
MLETLPRRSERPGRARRRGLLGLAILVILLVVLAAPVGWFSWATGGSGGQTPVVISIPKGATGSDIADLLAREHVIRSALGFRLYARLVRHSPLEFEAGKFQVATNMSAGEALDAMEKGPIVEAGIRVTFPEGYRLEQMAARAAKRLGGIGIEEEPFLAAAASGDFSLPPYLPAGTKTVEGFLFPSTYEFSKSSTVDDVIRRLLGQFGKVAEPLPWDQAEKLGVTPYEMVVVASMIEREARFEEDRAKIAAVIFNRLKKGMALQIDATVQYALGDWGPILIADREVDSPYNTYLHAGLPPTPIANPGEASLEAALSPAHANYLYYVVIDAAGHHAFTDSYDEFLRLKDQYKG